MTPIPGAPIAAIDFLNFTFDNDSYLH